MSVGRALLGAHVGKRADGEARVGEAAAARAAHGARDAEVADERVPFREEDVLGLDVAVDDVVRMRVREGVGDLAREADRLIDGELALALDPPAQRLARNVGHHIVERAFELSRIVEREDVRMLQAREQCDLATETLRGLPIGDFGVNEFQRDLAVVPHIVREIDGRHPATADLALDSILSGDDCSALARRGQLVCRLLVVGHVGRPRERRRA